MKRILAALSLLIVVGCETPGIVSNVNYRMELTRKNSWPSETVASFIEGDVIVGMTRIKSSGFGEALQTGTASKPRMEFLKAGSISFRAGRSANESFLMISKTID